MKISSPLLGFNDNVKYKGRLYHVQTEDSGIQRPHILTHLFTDGGRILKTLRTSYAERVGEDSLAQTVRALMKEQHRKMFAALRDGEIDGALSDGASVMPRPAPRSLPAEALTEAASSPPPASSTAPAIAAAVNPPREAPPPGRIAGSRPPAPIPGLSSGSAGSLFGDGSCRDQSLDEVILGYLAEVLGPSRSRK